MIQTMIITLKTPEDKAKVRSAIMGKDQYAESEPQDDPLKLNVYTYMYPMDIRELEGVTGVIPEKDICRCGSGKERYGLSDARGIFCCYMCEDCEKEKRSRYRAEVLVNSNYECDEPIEPEDY